MKSYILYTDGAARGNPGPAGAGWVILNAEGKLFKEGGKYLGETTNNQAEYQALVLALEEVPKSDDVAVQIFADSELMVRQINGDYKVKNEGLKPLFQKVVTTLSAFGEYKVTHVVREKNKRADELANEAIDSVF